jgi:hypothetical protein
VKAMSDDLISRSALVKKLNTEEGCKDTVVNIPPNATINEILNIGLKAYREILFEAIKEVPTAYDKEKVIEQLEEEKKTEHSLLVTPCMPMDLKYEHGEKCYKRAIGIVKAGGIE